MSDTVKQLIYFLLAVAAGSVTFNLVKWFIDLPPFFGFSILAWILGVVAGIAAGVYAYRWLADWQRPWH